jgi:hypothetical protein
VNLMFELSEGKQFQLLVVKNIKTLLIVDEEIQEIAVVGIETSRQAELPSFQIQHPPESSL